MSADPIQVVIGADSLERSRATVFFRVILALPHLIVLGLMGLAAVVLAFFAWVITVATGRLPAWMHGFFARVIRYGAHVSAYLYLGAEAWPPFLGERTYAIDVTIPQAPERQNRWTVLFRGLLALPALALAAAVGAGGASLSPSTAYYNVGLLPTIGLLAWFACLARGRMPRGMRDLLAYGVGYGAQVYAYLFLVTGRYPDSNPARLGITELPGHPVTLDLTETGLQRQRLMVFFRGLLALPHLVWLLLWSIAALFAAIAGWLVALATGRLPPALHDFLAARLRYQTHVYGFLYLVAEPFPGFVGAPGSYPVELTVAPPERQGRWTVFFRVVLVIPAALISGALGGAATVAAIMGWFAALFTGRMPRGLRNLLAFVLRYEAQVGAYASLVTPRYPFSGPGPCRD